MSEALNREYHEALGWKFGKRTVSYGVIDVVHSPKCKRKNGACGERQCALNHMKPFHLDASLCIAELDRVCGEQWTMDRDSNGFYCADQSCNYTEMGATFTEAALKCLIAAHKRESEAG